MALDTLDRSICFNHRFSLYRDATHCYWVDSAWPGVARIGLEQLPDGFEHWPEVEQFALGFAGPVLDPYPVTVASQPRHRNDLLFWQFPCRTEQDAWEQARSASSCVAIVERDIYIGLPWATFIDRNQAHRVTLFLMASRLKQVRDFLAQHGIRLRVHTVCQHVFWYRHLDWFRDLGVTDLWISHKEQGWDEEEGIRLHAWSLYAVNYRDPARQAGLEIKPVAERGTFASFVGAYMAHYLSDVRLRLQGLAGLPGYEVRLTNQWHFNQSVYQYQVNGEVPAADATDSAAVLGYNRMLSDSVFSLCPVGAGPNTLRLWESLATGAIPVVLSDRHQLPDLDVFAPGSGLRWEDALILHPEDQLDALDARLRAIPSERLQEMQRKGRQLYLLCECFTPVAAQIEPSLTDAAPRVTLPVDQAEPVVAERWIGLDDLYREADGAARRLPVMAADSAPLVSVLMTTHNVADYIEAAVTSVLRQTWPRLELIVVDDASTDATWTILERLQRASGGLRCRRLNTNLGTYFAKNHALQLAGGDYVFFQDGDDLSHPDRIRLCMQQLMQPGVTAVRGAYSRVRFPSGQVLPVNGLVRKLGLITLGLRRRVFDDIGSFNCTSKASDDEFFQRLMAWMAAKGGELRDLDLPLYYNTLREGSLFADMVANDPLADGCIEQRPSPSRSDYVDAFTARHKQLGVDGFRKFFSYPVLRDRIPVAPDMSRLVNPALPVVATLCSVPERMDLLRRTLASLVPQVDALHVYLDRYDEVPAFVRACHPNLTVVLSRDRPGLRDNGKFLPFANLERECYYFTTDDDIVYPPDYVAAMIRRIEHYGRQAVVGVHGVLLPERAAGYFSAFRKVLLFRNGLERDALVNNLGTGTLAFHSELLRGLDLSHFPQAGMADLYLSLVCKQRRIPMVAISRHDDWLLEMEAPSTLYQEFVRNDGAQAALVRSHWPWGYAAIGDAVAAVGLRAAQPEVGERLHALMPLLPTCLR
ncbi:glycosyltransferase [Malikia sp.]|uniref:glycosyltransferase n=1 Tax=Malikia sp. TaxID=2070706 RepID=UPI00260D37FD|nr:glycosyltransferase [Malikia sp.]MDD2728271.1 glycosyltransferase [Malikia sp.]